MVGWNARGRRADVWDELVDLAVGRKFVDARVAGAGS